MVTQKYGSRIYLEDRCNVGCDRHSSVDEGSGPILGHPLQDASASTVTGKAKEPRVEMMERVELPGSAGSRCVNI
jgi:hypothetical protein